MGHGHDRPVGSLAVGVIAVNPCRRCGHDVGAGSPQPNSCGECPPVQCVDCGGTDDRYCACWVSLDGMALADIKAILAKGDLSVETP